MRPAHTAHGHAHKHKQYKQKEKLNGGGVKPSPRRPYLLHLPRLLRHAAADEGVGEGEIADGAHLSYGASRSAALCRPTHSTRNPDFDFDLTSDVAEGEGVLEVGHQDGGDGAARPPAFILSPRHQTVGLISISICIISNPYP